MIGLFRRATVFPELLVRRYLAESLTTEGTTQLIDWKPDAIVLYCSDLDLIQRLRKKLPKAAIVATNGLQHKVIDAIVTGNGSEMIELALKHFFNNNLNNVALIFTGEKLTGQVFENELAKAAGADMHVADAFVHDIDAEILLHTPQGKWLEKIGEWLQGLPTPIGIFTLTNHTAAYLIHVCRHLGLAIPGEIQLIGCDELDESLESLPHVTSIHVPFERIGGAALEMTVKLLNGEKLDSRTKLMNGATLLPRGSTGLLPTNLSDVPAAIAYIESHATQGINVDDVLNQTQHVSRMTFYREFKCETGDSPARYIRCTQLEAARKLLSATELEITRIAELTGFSSSNYFSQVFRRDTGMTPCQYRISHKGKK